MAGDQKLPRIPGADSVYMDGRGFYTAVFNYINHHGEKDRKPIRSKTSAGLKHKSRELLMKLESTGMMPGASPTVEQWMNHWLNDIAALDVRPKTLANYRSLTNAHIIKHLGTTRLDQINQESVRRLTKQILATKTRNGDPLSSTTALTVHRVLSSALSAAESEGKIAKNWARLVKAPRRNIPDIEPLTVEEATTLLQTFQASEQAFLWATYLLTGARRGEILGLQWDRVTDSLNLEWQLQRHPVNMTAPVDYEYQPLGGGLYLTRPKTQDSVRSVPLFEPLRTILENWRAVSPSNPHNLVFTTAQGRPIDPDEATRAWHKALRAAGITRRVRLHDTRHTAIDLMIEAGVEEDIIREVVGHSKVIMTRAYRSASTRKRLQLGLEPFARMLTRPAELDSTPGSATTPTETDE